MSCGGGQGLLHITHKVMEVNLDMYMQLMLSSAPLSSPSPLPWLKPSLSSSLSSLVFFLPPSLLSLFFSLSEIPLGCCVHLSRLSRRPWCFGSFFPARGSFTARECGSEHPGLREERGTGNPDRHEVSPPLSSFLSSPQLHHPHLCLRVPFHPHLGFAPPDLLSLASFEILAGCPSQYARTSSG